MAKQLTKYMTIGLTDDKTCGVQISPDLDCTTALQLLGTLALHILNAYYTVATTNLTPIAETTKEPTKEELDAATLGIKESMYDAADNIFSSVLTQFYPDAPASTIEDEAILELVNHKIEERYNKMSDEEKAVYSKVYADTIKRLLDKTVQNRNKNKKSKDDNKGN